MSPTRDSKDFAAVVDRGQLLMWLPMLMALIATVVLVGGW